MTSPTRDSPGRKKVVIATAAKLFSDHGYEATTLRMISQASRVAVGSLNHYFTDKAGLATAVYEDALGDLVAAAGTGLRGHGRDIRKAIHALFMECDLWSRDHPRSRRLLRILAPRAVPALRNVEPHEERLAVILAGWASLHIELGLVRKLSPSQFYALILAPLMSDWVNNSSSLTTEGAAEREMHLSVFAEAALAGIQTEQVRRTSRKATANSVLKRVSSEEKKQSDLLAGME